VGLPALPGRSRAPAPQPIDQLRQRATEKPEAIAAMMRNWMAEDGR